MSGRGKEDNWDSVASLRHPCPCGGLMHEHRMDDGVLWLDIRGLEFSTNDESGHFGAKRRRGFGGYGPQCMKCHNRKKAAAWLPFCDSVGIRTQDPQLRRLLLYPAELRNRTPLKRECKVREIF